jgi:hypothetical protein
MRQAHIEQRGDDVVVHTPLGDLTDMLECPLPGAYAGGLCDVLLRADDIVHDDNAPVKAQIVRKAFRGSEFLYTLKAADGRDGDGACAFAPQPRAGRVDRHTRRGRPCGHLPRARRRIGPPF